MTDEGKSMLFFLANIMFFFSNVLQCIFATNSFIVIEKIAKHERTRIDLFALRNLPI